MKKILALEETALTLISIYALSRYSLGLPVWGWLILFFSPDMGMLGYLVNTKTGAITYNLLHHKGLAVGVALSGYYLHSDVVTSMGILLFAHASFDRVWGYGLKYMDDFKHTHMGWMQQPKG